jgi:hypothetical protein
MKDFFPQHHLVCRWSPAGDVGELQCLIGQSLGRGTAIRPCLSFLRRFPLQKYVLHPVVVRAGKPEPEQDWKSFFVGVCSCPLIGRDRPRIDLVGGSGAVA